MDHAFFVLASYGATAIVFACLIVWLVADGRGRKRDLAALEKAGISRRSVRKGKA